MHGRKVIKAVILTIICLLIASYGLFQARKVIEGPLIVIESPIDGSTIDKADLEVIGSAKNIAFLFLNGKKIYTNDQGNFKETTLIGMGTSVLELKATDKFGKEIIHRITVFRN